MKASALRSAIEADRSAIGSYVMMDNAASAGILAHLGYDFIVIDQQHAAIDLRGLQSAVAATKGTSCAPIVRVHPRRPDQIEWALDLGAHGVVVPLVNSPDDALLATQACRYPPVGRRSVAALRNVLERGKEYMRESNDDVVCIIQIEHFEAVECIDEILDIGGIDAVMPGHVDLAMSMGHTIDYGSSVSNAVPDEVAKAMSVIEVACASRSIPVIPVVGSPKEYGSALQKGQKIACCNTDFHLFMSAAASQLAGCKAEEEK